MWVLAIEANDELRPAIASELTSPDVSPTMSVLIPSVVMIGSMPSITMMKALIAPTAVAAATATMHAGTYPQWSLTTSIGTTVAARPIVAEIERSNSPTAKTTTDAIPRNTSACWEPKIVWKVPVVRKTPGSMIANTAASTSHTPTSA